MAVCLSKCARSGKPLLTDRASRDVLYLLQCLKRCSASPAVPQEMCRTSCSASRDVPHLLQCLKRCVVPPVVPQEMCRISCSAPKDVPYLLQCLKRCAYLLQCRVMPRHISLRSVPTSLTVGAFRVCSSQLTVLTTWWSCTVTASPSVSPNSCTRLTQIFDFCWLGSCGRRWCSCLLFAMAIVRRKTAAVRCGRSRAPWTAARSRAESWFLCKYCGRLFACWSYDLIMSIRLRHRVFRDESVAEWLPEEGTICN